MPVTEEVRVVRALARLARMLERALGALTLAQYRVLAAVDDGGERATHLAHALALAKPTVTAAVDVLVERGLLSREPVPHDRRSVRIALTGSGHDALAAAEAAMAARLHAVLAPGGADAGGREALAALAALAALVEGEHARG